MTISDDDIFTNQRDEGDSFKDEEESNEEDDRNISFSSLEDDKPKGLPAKRGIASVAGTES